MSRPHFLFVIPHGASNPRTGGGQRTRILYDALLHEGRVSVLLLADREGPGPAEFFPGAEDVRSIEVADYGPAPSNKAEKLVRALRRATLPWREFATDAPFAQRLADIIKTQAIDAVAFRYLRGFAISGLAGGAVPCLVDVDDRDDAKFESHVAGLVGDKAARIAYRPWLTRMLTPRITGLLDHAAHVWIAKPADRPEIGDTPVTVWPNVPFFEVPRDVPPPSEARDILFVGSIGHRPNREGVQWFLHQCWPEIASAAPDIRLRLVGLGNWTGVIPEDITARDRVDVVGPVDDLGAEYTRARLVICPILVGAGSQIKVIEAAAWARPVVATPLAAGGFGEDIAQAVSRAETPAAFARACTVYATDPARADADGTVLQKLQRATLTRQSIAKTLAHDIARAVS